MWLRSFRCSAQVTFSGWDVSSARGMEDVFNGATSFNSDLSSWFVLNFRTEPEGFDDGAASWTLPRRVWSTCAGG
ncbi:MAG: BspA family leucine-rich repeat surface protein [Longimicrobiales bacterium]